MRYKLTELIDVEKKQKLLDSFCEAVGIAAAIIDLEGKVLIGSRWQSICTDFHRVHKETLIRCIESDTQVVSELSAGKPFSLYRCRNGLTDAASPIIIEGEYVANAFVGQFLVGSPDIDFFLSQATKYGFNKSAYLEALSRVPVIAEETLPSVLAFLITYSEMIAAVSLKQLKQLETEEELRKDHRKLEVLNKRLHVTVKELTASQEEVRRRAEHYSALFENMLDGFAHCKMLFENGQPVDFEYISVNRAFEDLTGLKNVIGRKASEIIPGIRESNPDLIEIYGRVALTGRPERFETYVPELGIWFFISVYSLEKGSFIAIFDNITENKKAEEALKSANQELEKRIDERTSDLEAKKRNLEEVNTALRVLLDRREEDKREYEEAIAGNLKSLVLPYIEKLQRTQLSAEQETYLSILKSHLHEIESRFVTKLSLHHLGLTPTEMQVAALVRDGKATKEIACVLHASEKAVEFHRNNIRRKLSIKNKKENLRSHLMILR